MASEEEKGHLQTGLCDAGEKCNDNFINHQDNARIKSTHRYVYNLYSIECDVRSLLHCVLRHLSHRVALRQRLAAGLVLC